MAKIEFQRSNDVRVTLNLLSNAASAFISVEFQFESLLRHDRDPSIALNASWRPFWDRYSGFWLR